MFLLYVLGVFALSLFGSQCQPQTRETVFHCYSWGDPHVQTWRPKNGDQIRNRDCYVNGPHTFVNNSAVDLEGHVHNKWVNKVDAKIYDVHHNEAKQKVLFHFVLSESHKPTADENLRQAEVTLKIVTSGARTTYTLSYPRANVSIIIIEQAGRIENINIYVPYALALQSGGLCTEKDAACTLRGVATDELEWEPVRSGSTKQIFTNQQAEMICNEHIETFFAKIHRAPYQRDAHVNSMVTSVLAGCIDDVVLTGEIEAAEASIGVLMIDELTKDAETVEDIQAAVDSGIEQASFLLNDAVKTANARVRRMI